MACERHHITLHRSQMASRRLRRQFRDIRPVFILHSSAFFLSVCETWIYRLLPALHAHLSCTTLLNSEERALSEKKRKKEENPRNMLEGQNRKLRG